MDNIFSLPETLVIYHLLILLDTSNTTQQSLHQVIIGQLQSLIYFR